MTLYDYFSLFSDERRATPTLRKYFVGPEIPIIRTHFVPTLGRHDCIIFLCFSKLRKIATFFLFNFLTIFSDDTFFFSFQRLIKGTKRILQKNISNYYTFFFKQRSSFSDSISFSLLPTYHHHPSFFSIFGIWITAAFI